MKDLESCMALAECGTSTRGGLLWVYSQIEHIQQNRHCIKEAEK